MKIEKGTPGYLNARKIRLLLLTLLEFAIVIALLVLGYMQTGTRLNLLTVVAIVGCLPACKVLVGLITLLPYRTADQDKAAEIREKAPLLTTAFDLVITSREKIMPVEAVVISAQHDAAVTQEQIHEDIKKYVFDAVIPGDMVDDETKFFINPTGRFVIGGPHGDSGLTGRKIIVDTYGGMARHGGGAFSGKDCTKVDRSAAYAARYAAKNIVAAGLAKRCEIQLSYAIGVARPTSISVDTFGTGKVSDDKLVEIIRENFDLRPAGIIKMLDLRRPIYKQTASYGHFGRTDLDLPWEKLDKVDLLKAYLQK